MKVLVDSSVWSLALRRTRNVTRPRGAQGEEHVETHELGRLIGEGNVRLIGPVRQEVLSGIRESTQFERLRVKLAEFPDTAVIAADYELAASFFNRCRAKGLQGSNTDFLICAVSARSRMPIFTADGDFALFKKYLPITLHKVRPIHIPNIRSH